MESFFQINTDLLSFRKETQIQQNVGSKTVSVPGPNFFHMDTTFWKKFHL